MTKFTAASLGIIGMLCVAIAMTGTSTRAASSTPAPAPAVSVTTLPALPSAAVPTAHPAAMSPAPAATPAAASPQPGLSPQPQLSPVPPPPFALITVSGRVAKPITVTIDQLRNMHDVSLTMRVVDADGKHRFHIYTGASLPGIIDQAQPLTFGGTERATAAWVIVSGVSGGPTVVGFPEFESAFGGHRVILAYTVDGKPYKQGALLVIEGDATALRFVSGVTAISVQESAQAVPLATPR